MNRTRTPAAGLVLRSAAASAARAHAYTLMARAHLWLARAAAATPGSSELDVERQKQFAESYRSLAKDQRRHAQGAIGLALSPPPPPPVHGAP